MLKILVTGSAGLIGGEVCARLIRDNHSVTALVRRTREVRSNDGELVDDLEIVSGDVTLPLLGLEPTPHDVVIHCAASLEFDAPEEALRAVNVEGTRNALEYAKAAGASFLHVSTAYVCGQREGEIEEGPVPAGNEFTNRYEASKAAAEALVAGAGIPFAIARPSIVLGHSKTGEIREFPSLCNVFRLMARGKVTVIPSPEGSVLDFVPIDHVAEGIARIAERMEEANGRYFHLVSSDPLPAVELVNGVTRVPHFPDPQIVSPEDYAMAELRPTERMLAGKMLGTFGAYFIRSPHFNDNGLRAFTGLQSPPTDGAWLDRLIAHGISCGYLPSPR